MHNKLLFKVPKPVKVHIFFRTSYMYGKTIMKSRVRNTIPGSAYFWLGCGVNRGYVQKMAEIGLQSTGSDVS